MYKASVTMTNTITLNRIITRIFKLWYCYSWSLITCKFLTLSFSVCILSLSKYLSSLAINWFWLSFAFYKSASSWKILGIFDRTFLAISNSSLSKRESISTRFSFFTNFFINYSNARLLEGSLSGVIIFWCLLWGKLSLVGLGYIGWITYSFICNKLAS